MPNFTIMYMGSTDGTELILFFFFLNERTVLKTCIFCLKTEEKQDTLPRCSIKLKASMQLEKVCARKYRTIYNFSYSAGNAN